MKNRINFATFALSLTLLTTCVWADSSSSNIEGGVSDNTPDSVIEYNANTNSYNVFQDVEFGSISDLIQQNGFIDDTFILDGNGYNIDGNGQVGLVTVSGQTANISNVGVLDDELSKGFSGFNNPQGNGGAFNNAGIASVINSKFSNNNAKYGGAVYNTQTGVITISDSVFSNNTSTNYGSGVYNAGKATISNSKFFNNESATGSAVTNFKPGIMTITDSVFSNNHSKSVSGAFHNNGTLNIFNSKFLNNSSDTNGGVSWNDGILTIYDSEFSNNSSLTDGGVFQANLGDITVHNSVFSNNKATDSGGAVLNTGAFFAADSNFYNNSAGSEGGAIYINANNAAIYTENKDSIFTGNTANGVSNAIHNNSILFLNPISGTNIIFNDAITGNDGDIYINYNVSNGFFPRGGVVEFNNLVSGNTVRLAGGTLKLGAFKGETIDGKVIAPSVGNFDETVAFGLWGGTLDLKDNKIRTDYKVGYLDADGGKLALDIQFNGNDAPKADMFTIDEGGGLISFEHINCFGETPTVDKEVQIISGEAAKDFEFSDFAIFSSEDLVTITHLDDKPGFVLIDVENTKQDLNTALAWTASDRSFVMKKDEVLASNLGSMHGKSMHIDGNGYSLIGNGFEGITVGSGQELTMYELASVEGFKDDIALINNGTVHLSDVTLNNKILGTSTSILNLSEVNTFNSVIEGNKINLRSGFLNLGPNADISNAASFNVYFSPEVNLQNGVIQDTNFGNLVLNSNLNLKLDSNFATEKIDTISAKSFKGNGHNINISNINVMEPTTKEEFSMSVLGNMPDESVKNAISNSIVYTGREIALSPIFKYHVKYDTNDSLLKFSIYEFEDDPEPTDIPSAPSSGGTKPAPSTPQYQNLNPGIMAGAVAAQLGGYLTQLQSYDEAFRSLDTYMLMTKKQRQAMKLRNKYASISQGAVFDSAYYNNNDAWFRPYATFERVNLSHGPKVSNVAYGSFFGGDSKLYELGNGWDATWGVYAGYNGSHQAYDGVSIYQNGGTLGLSGFAYKGNYFMGLTANASASSGTANAALSSDDFTMLMAGIAAKTGYNLELAEGKFVVQPSLLMSYSFVNTFDFKSAGVNLDSDPLHAIQVEPGIKFIANLDNGWQPYLGVSMVWNILDKTHFMANDVTLPNLSIDPFVKYGVGIRRVWSDKFTGYLQTYLTNGGRNGVGLQAGFSWLLGKDTKDKTANAKVNPRSLNTAAPKLKKAEVSLENVK